jgi:hypothetical protein
MRVAIAAKGVVSRRVDSAARLAAQIVRDSPPPMVYIDSWAPRLSP